MLAVRNDHSSEINSVCTRLFAGQIFVCNSADSVFHIEDICRYPIEYLNTLSVPGVPEHRLHLKIGMPVILLRNLSPKLGLCNGVRLTVKEVKDRTVFVTLKNGEVFGIPRISLIIDEKKNAPFKWRRRQFPLRPAFSMTINKVQGQTMEKVAVWLETPVFAHGQFYTAASRVRNPENIRFFVSETEDTSVTTNIVYKEIL